MKSGGFIVFRDESVEKCVEIVKFLHDENCRKYTKKGVFPRSGGKQLWKSE